MSSSTETIVKALRVLAREIQCDDGVANAAIGEAADRLETQQDKIEALETAGDEMMADPCEYTFEQWIQAKESK